MDVLLLFGVPRGGGWTELERVLSQWLMWWTDADVLGEYFNDLYFDGEALLFVDGQLPSGTWRWD